MSFKPQFTQRISRTGGAPIETPVFSKTHDLLAWLIPLTLKFPREQRFVGAAYLQQSANELLLRLLQAQRSAAPHARLLHADVALAQMRMQWRLAYGWALFGDTQFEHGVRLMAEVGRLLGAWLKNTKPAAMSPLAASPTAP